MASELVELVYADDEARKFIKGRWPAATFTDARDSVHDARFEVTIPDVDPDEFYPAMLVEGWGGACFRLALSVRLPDHHDEVRRWLDLAESLLGAEVDHGE